MSKSDNRGYSAERPYLRKVRLKGKVLVTPGEGDFKESATEIYRSVCDDCITA